MEKTLKETLLEKVGSWPMWVALASMVVLIAKFMGFDIAQDVNEFMVVLLSLLVAFGIVNDPNSRTSF